MPHYFNEQEINFAQYKSLLFLSLSLTSTSYTDNFKYLIPEMNKERRNKTIKYNIKHI